MSIPKASLKQLTQDVEVYKEIRAKIEFLSAQMRPVKERIESVASKIPTGKIITEEYKVILSEVQRENFNLKEAKLKLGEKALKPFMSTSVYTQLRVS